jgi:soluble cytochrome b562
VTKKLKYARNWGFSVKSSFYNQQGEIMSDNDMPNVEEIKERLKIEEEDLNEEATKAESLNITDELQNLGKQVADTLRSAWESDQRQKVETEVREGMKSFANEIDKVLKQVREGTAAQKIKEEAADAKAKMESSDLPNKARSGVVSGLKWLSVELGKLADQFAPTEKAAEDEEA